MKRIFIYCLTLTFLLSGFCLYAQTKVVDRPVFDAWNSNIAEVDKIDLSDTATILYLDLFARPQARIRMAGDAFIRENGKTDPIAVKYMKGINPDTDVSMPESGKMSIQLVFPPLAKTVQKIDFMEGNCDECFKIWGISLSGKQPSKTQLPDELLSYKPANAPLSNVGIKSGAAVFSGRILGSVPEEMLKSPISLSVLNIVSGDRIDYTVSVEKDQSFRKEIPVLSPGIAIVRSEFYSGVAYLAPGEESKIFIDFPERCRMQSRYLSKEKENGTSVYMVNSLGLSAKEMELIVKKPQETFDRRKLPQEVYGLNPQAYKELIDSKLQTSVQELQSDPEVSETGRQLAAYELKANAIAQLMAYETNLKIAYAVKNKLKVRSLDEVDFTPEKPDITYYSFLKDYNLNDPGFLYTLTYSTIVDDILGAQIFNGSGEKVPVKEQAKNRGQELKKATGSDSGLFYDLLTAREYSKQISGMQPLSDTEIADVNSYFTSKAISGELLAENNSILKMKESGSNDGVIINDAPAVGNDKVLDAILAKYKGKVVFLDFWATWCGPCRKAMKDADPVKESFKGKDVVFVYITGTTSPMKKWQEMVPGIHGEHFRLTDEQWEYLSGSLGIQGIPAYFVYDKEGVQKYKSSGFMGVEKMEQWISENL